MNRSALAWLALFAGQQAPVAAPVQVDQLSADCAPLVSFAQGSTINVLWSRTASRSSSVVLARGPESWTAPTPVLSDGIAWYQAVAEISPSSACLVFARPSGTGWHLQASWTVDAGFSWSAPAPLPLGVGNELSPSIVSSGSMLALGWINQRGASYEYSFSRSVDNGLTWSVPTALSTFGRYCEGGSLASDGASSVYAAWTEQKGDANVLSLRQSHDFGLTWSPPVQLSPDGGNDQAAPRVAISASGNLVVASQQYAGGSWSVVAWVSTDGGTNWSGPVTLNVNGSASAYNPSVAANSTNGVCLAWVDESTSPPAVTWRESLNGGVTWGAPTSATAGYGFGAYPRITPSATKGWDLTWVEQAGNSWLPHYQRVGSTLNASVSSFALY